MVASATPVSGSPLGGNPRRHLPAEAARNVAHGASASLERAEHVKKGERWSERCDGGPLARCTENWSIFELLLRRSARCSSARKIGVISNSRILSSIVTWIFFNPSFFISPSFQVYRNSYLIPKKIGTIKPRFK